MHEYLSVCLLYLLSSHVCFGSILNVYMFSDHKSTVQMFELSSGQMGGNTKSVTLKFFVQ